MSRLKAFAQLVALSAATGAVIAWIGLLLAYGLMEVIR